MVQEREPVPPPSTDETVEGLVDEYVVALAEGRSPEPQELAARLADPSRAVELAARLQVAEFLWRRERGERVSPDDLLGRLEGEEQRAVGREVLADHERASRVLPGELPPGVVLGGFVEIEEHLGSGGFGEVYRARHLSFERRSVAVKVFRSDDPHGRLEQVRHEAQVLAELECRNVVRVLDVRRDAGRSFLVMELVRGTSLDRVLAALRRVERNEPLREAVARRPERLAEAIGQAREAGRDELADPRSWYRTVAAIGARMARALALAHARGIVHRDLKPGNVLLVGGGEPVLVDFGLAAALGGDDLSLGDLQGTPTYLPPEQVESLRPGTDPRSDVYQLGLLLHELVGLERAFPSPRRVGTYELFRRIQAAEVAPLEEHAPDLPPALAAIIGHARAPRPEDRYAGAAEVQEDLERFASGRPPRHAPLPARLRLATWLRFAWRSPAGVVALAALAALGALWLALPRGWGPPRVEAILVTGAVEPGILREERGILREERLEVARDAAAWLRVQTRQGCWLYGVGLTGEGTEGPLYVEPLEVLDGDRNPLAPPGEPTALEAGERGLAGILLEPGRRGFLLFASRRRSELLDQWLAQLRSDTAPPGRASREYALGLLRSLSSPGRSGGPEGGLSPEQRERLVDLAPRAELEHDPVGEAGIVRYDFLWEVRGT